MNLNKIELLPLGQVQLRYEKVLYDAEGNEVLTGTFHRDTKYPGQDISDLPVDTQAVLNAHWTTEIVDAWNLKMLEQEE